MYSVRVTTTRHGNTYLNMLAVNVVITGLLTWRFGIDYLTVFCSSGVLVTLIEVGLALSGVRKGVTYVHGYELPRLGNALLHGFVDGPGFCVPAYFVADQVLAGHYALGIIGAGVVVAFASLYMGLADWWNLRRLGPGEEPIWSRRAMTKPVAVVLLALLNAICLAAMLLMPAPYRTHVFVYLGAYSLMVMLFYAINYALGVRMVQRYDPEQETFTTPGPLVQALGLTFDSAYEMALLISPAHWVPFYLGLLEFGTLGVGSAG